MLHAGLQCHPSPQFQVVPGRTQEGDYFPSFYTAAHEVHNLFLYFRAQFSQVQIPAALNLTDTTCMFRVVIKSEMFNIRNTVHTKSARMFTICPHTKSYTAATVVTNRQTARC
jgi:hypothetical protein